MLFGPAQPQPEPEPTTLPFAVLLLEPAETTPFTFSPIAPGYFMPSPGWALPPKKGAQRWVSTYAPNPRVLKWSAGHVGNMLASLTEILGPDLAKIVAADRRGMASNVPPKDRHRLGELIHGFSPAVHLALREARPYIDPIVIAELHATVEILKRAAKEAVWPEIGPSCVSPNSFRHTLSTFLALEVLERRRGRPLPLLSVSSDTREPDVTLDLNRHVHLEIKVPRALVWKPTDAPNFDVDVIEGLVDRLASTAVGNRGQIRPDRPGMLVLGGFNATVEVAGIEDGARAYMARRGRQYPYLTAIGLAVINFGRSPGLSWAARAMPVFNFVPNPHAIFEFP